MSAKICVQFEIRNMLIMKDTLKQMGIDYNELNAEQLEIHRRYRPIEMNSRTGEITFDDVDQTYVEGIQQKYMVNIFKDQAIREGNQLKEEVQPNGEIHLTLLH